MSRNMATCKHVCLYSAIRECMWMSSTAIHPAWVLLASPLGGLHPPPQQRETGSHHTPSTYLTAQFHYTHIAVSQSLTCILGERTLSTQESAVSFTFSFRISPPFQSDRGEHFWSLPLGQVVSQTCNTLRICHTLFSILNLP